MFAKIKQFSWCDLKTWTAPNITRWNFLKIKAVFLKWLENLNYPYYHEIKCSQKYPDLMKLLECLNCPYYCEGKSFSKIKQFCWCDLKIWTVPIITSSNVRKNKAILLKWLKNLNCRYYHELKFSEKYGRFYEVTWKFALPQLSRGKTFPKIKQFCWRDLKAWHALIITVWNFCKN